MSQERRILGTEHITRSPEEALSRLSSLYADVTPGTIQSAALIDLANLYDKQAMFNEMREVQGDDFPHKDKIMGEITTITASINQNRTENPTYNKYSRATESLTNELNAYYRKPEKNLGNSTRQITLDLQRVQGSIEEKITLREIVPPPSMNIVFDVRELPGNVV